MKPELTIMEVFDKFNVLLTVTQDRRLTRLPKFRRVIEVYNVLYIILSIFRHESSIIIRNTYLPHINVNFIYICLINIKRRAIELRDVYIIIIIKFW